MLGLCRALLRNPTEAEDAAQATFLAAFRSLLKGTVPRESGAWIATIARHECWNRVRSRMREPLPTSETEHVAGGEDPLALAISNEDVGAFWEAFRGLARPQQRAFLLREFGGLSYDELALALGVSGPAVESLLFRARRTLRTSLATVAALPLALRDLLAQFGTGAAATSVAVKTATVTVGVALVAATATGLQAPHRYAHAHAIGSAAAAAPVRVSQARRADVREPAAAASAVFVSARVDRHPRRPAPITVPVPASAVSQATAPVEAEGDQPAAVASPQTPESAATPAVRVEAAAPETGSGDQSSQSQDGANQPANDGGGDHSGDGGSSASSGEGGG